MKNLLKLLMEIVTSVLSNIMTLSVFVYLLRENDGDFIKAFLVTFILVLVVSTLIYGYSFLKTLEKEQEN